MNEIWKPIPGFNEEFYASNLGNIKRTKRVWTSGRGYKQIKEIPESMVKQRILKDGYKKCTISLYGCKKSYSVHRLIALAFIPNPNNYQCVNHIDGNKQNNKVTNLEWCSHKYNSFHSMYVINKLYGVNSPNCKFTEEDILFIRKNYKPRDKEFGRKSLAIKFNVSPSTIGNVIKNKNYDIK